MSGPCLAWTTKTTEGPDAFQASADLPVRIGCPGSKASSGPALRTGVRTLTCITPPRQGDDGARSWCASRTCACGHRSDVAAGQPGFISPLPSLRRRYRIDGMPPWAPPFRLPYNPQPARPFLQFCHGVRNRIFRTRTAFLSRLPLRIIRKALRGMDSLSLLCLK